MLPELGHKPTKRQIAKAKQYLLSYFLDEPETPEDIQNLILRILKHDGYGTSRCIDEKVTEDDSVWCLNKSKLLSYLRYVFPRFSKHRNGDPKNQKDSQILRQLNNLIRQGVLTMQKHKRTNYVVRGRAWTSRCRSIQKMRSEMSVESLLTTIIMGDCPARRARFIKENGRGATLDV